MIQGMHHLAIIVSSEDNVGFYERLGFVVFKCVKRRQDKVLLLHGHGIKLEMFVDASHLPRSVLEPLGFRHLALRVDDIAKASREMELDIGPIMEDWLEEKFCFTSDPDGNMIVFHE